jgi:hypothetical protein
MSEPNSIAGADATIGRQWWAQAADRVWPGARSRGAAGQSPRRTLCRRRCSRPKQSHGYCHTHRERAGGRYEFICPEFVEGEFTADSP